MLATPTKSSGRAETERVSVQIENGVAAQCQLTTTVDGCRQEETSFQVLDGNGFAIVRFRKGGHS